LNIRWSNIGEGGTLGGATPMIRARCRKWGKTDDEARL